MNYKVLKNIPLLLMILLLSCVQVNAQAVELTSQQQRLKQQLAAVQNNHLMVGQSKIALFNLINNFYQYGDYQLAWQQPAMIELLLKAIDESERLGLSENDYHRTDIKARMEGHQNNTDQQRIELDIILMDSFLRLVYHLRFGKVVPATLDPDWNFKRQLFTTDPVAKLHYTLRSEQNLKKFINKITHLGPFYQGLIDALAQYRQIQRSGGWQTIASGQLIKPGMKDSRVAQIKARLQASGDLKKDKIDPQDSVYNAQLEQGVKLFQQRHTLEMDGVIGDGTIAEMNISVAQRIDQIKANLERIRWVKPNLADEFVLVNVAGYEIYYVRENKLVWQSKVQVGKDYRKTPVFRDDIKYVVFNPTWTVPPTILTKDVLPKIKKDRGYLKKKNMSVVNSKGKIINPSKINWSAVTAANFPYMIRQEPGPHNSLGRVKIMFPNDHLVYLHDTPSKSKFDRAERAFSSGCIRVENPFELVELLLKNNNWNQTVFQEILDSGKLQNVTLPETVPVLVLYFTVRKAESGQIVFYKDIYERDNKVINGLKKPFQLVIPEQQ